MTPDLPAALRACARGCYPAEAGAELPGMRIWVDGQWFYVSGILNKDTYAPEMDTAVWSASRPRKST